MPSAAFHHQQPLLQRGSFTVRDYVGGGNAGCEGVIRLIGNPETRYRESVRMLRACVSLQLNMRISLKRLSQSRVWQPSTTFLRAPVRRESLQALLQAGNGFETYQQLREYNPLPAVVSYHYALFHRKRRQRNGTHHCAGVEEYG